MPQVCSDVRNLWTCASIVALMTFLHGCGNSKQALPTPKPTSAPGPPSPEDECKGAMDVRPFGVVNSTTYKGKMLGNVTLGVSSEQDFVWACLCDLDPNGWSNRSRNSTDGIPISVTPLGKDRITNLTSVICTTFDYGAKLVPATGSYSFTSRHLPVFAPKPAPFECTKVSGECIYVHVKNERYGSWALAQNVARNLSWRNAPPENFSSSTWFSLEGPTFSWEDCSTKDVQFVVEYVAGFSWLLRLNRRCEESSLAIITEITYPKSMKLLEGDYDDPYVLVLQFEDQPQQETVELDDVITTIRRTSGQRKIVVEASSASARTPTPGKATRLMLHDHSVAFVEKGKPHTV